MAAKPTKASGNNSKFNNSQCNGIVSEAINNLCKFNNNDSKHLNNGNIETVTANSSRTASTSSDTADTTQLISNAKTNCDCTNISIMHLFHEMKQEFPTIPDQIVAECVNENCHQRENCFKILQNELALHPAPVQAYPAKVLQQLQQTIPKKSLNVLRRSPATNNISSTINTAATTQSTPTLPTPATRANWCWPNNIVNKQQSLEEQNENIELLPIIAHDELEQQPRLRPTTLNLVTPQQKQYQQLQVQLKQHIQHRNQQQQVRPLRRAPLPPLPPKPTNLNGITPIHKQITTTPTEISPNKNGYRSADQSPIRHRAVLNMKPQLPYEHILVNSSTPTTSPHTSGAGQKSFTTVNLTLRQPQSGASTPPSTIDIAAGPCLNGGNGSGLKYSITSYNAQQGYQKTFNLTVSDEGGEFHASRVRSPTADGSLQSPNQFNALPMYNTAYATTTDDYTGN